MTWTVETEYVSDWLLDLDEATYDDVIGALRLLSETGPHLGRPYVDTITGSYVNNLKELRPGSPGRSEIRILFAFDPLRRAVLLIAGDKRNQWNRWYRRNIPLAEQVFRDHLERMRGSN